MRHAGPGVGGGAQRVVLRRRSCMRAMWTELCVLGSQAPASRPVWGMAQCVSSDLEIEFQVTWLTSVGKTAGGLTLGHKGR